MDPILGKTINRIVIDCVEQRKELDKIVEEHLEARTKFRDGHKKRSLLFELRILTWIPILIQLEKKLADLPIC